MFDPKHNPLNLTQDQIETLMRGDEIAINTPTEKPAEPGETKTVPLWQYFLRTPEASTWLQKTVTSRYPLKKGSTVIYDEVRYKVCTIGSRTLEGKRYRTATIKRIKDVQ